MNSLYWITQAFYLNFLLVFMVGIGIVELVIALKTLGNKEHPEEIYYKNLYNKKLTQRLLVYGTVILTVLASVYFNLVALSLVIIGLFAIAILSKRNKWTEMETGYALVRENRVKTGGEIKLNNHQKGIVTELGLTTMAIRTPEGAEYSLPYSRVRSIETAGSYVLLKNSLVLNFREDPKKALEHFQMVIERLNETQKENLAENSNFQLTGITETNSGYHGMLYTIEAMVKTDKKEEVSAAVNFALADMAYEKNLKMAETNVYYRTRMSSK